MRFSRRRFLHLAGVAALPIFSQAAAAQAAYPNRPVRIVVGFAPGGGVDVTARLIGQALSERLGQQFVIENRPGAGTNIGTEAVVNAVPDGYTLLLATNPNAVNATLYEKLNFNFIRDIAPIAMVSRVPNVMEVHPSFPATTIGDFVAYAKAHPGQINFASAGIGASDHMAGEMFKAMTGIDLVHVPYRGVAPALNDLIGAQVQVMFGSMPSTIQHIKTGKLRALAVTTPIRSDALPEVPSISEVFPGYEASTWYGVGAPKKTPRAIIERLNTEINAALADPKLKARFAELGEQPISMSPAEFEKFVADETERWGRVVRLAGLKAE
jgi:tripartite-type tricarboxylate transporter receptor subunit TctC